VLVNIRSSQQAENERQAIVNTFGGTSGHADVDAGAIVSFLFPMLDPNSNPHRSRAPQGVAMSFPTDYWRRLNAEHIDHGELRDQPVLKLMRDAKTQLTARSELLSRLLEDQQFADKFEQFASRELSLVVNWRGTEIRTLTSDLFSELLRRFGPAASGDQAPGFFALWRSLLKKQEGNHFSWLSDELCKAITVSARFTADLIYFWGLSTEDRGFWDAPTPPKVAFDALVRAAREQFEDKPERLSAVFDNSDPRSLSKLVYSADKFDTDPNVWQWLGPILLDAAHGSPEILVPQIACAISKSEHEFVRHSGEVRNEIQYTFTISDEGIRRLFDAENQKRAIALLAKARISANPHISSARISEP
jgi:hypothetical protein